VAGVFVVRTMTRVRVPRPRCMTGVGIGAARGRASRVCTMLSVPGVMRVICERVIALSSRCRRPVIGM
jgi:hypothetical protein